MDCKSFDDELRCLGLCTIGERRNRQDLTEVFKIFKGLYRVRLMNCLCRMKTRKVLRVTVCNLEKLGAAGISLGIFRIG